MQVLDTTELAALAAALGFASGIRLYAVLFVVGLAGAVGWVELPPGLALLAHPLVLSACGLMMAVEFFADKVPAIDSLWDAIHTLIRIPAGAALAAAVFGGDSAAWAAVAALAGGSLAATSHFTKAGARAAVNASPEPASNIAVSSAEDVAVGVLLWLAFAHPLAALSIIAGLVALSLWLLPKVFRFLRGMLGRALRIAGSR